MNLPFFIGLRYASGSGQTYQTVSFLSKVSVYGLVVGVALLITVLSIMNGFDRELRLKILGLVPQAAVYHKNAIADWTSLKTKLEKHANVVAASPFVQLDGMVTKHSDAQPVMIFGIDPSLEADVSRIGEFLSPDSLTLLSGSQRNIVLGHGVAEKLKLAVGDSVMVIVPDTTTKNTTPKLAYFTVVDILRSQTELDNTLAITGLKVAAELSATPDRVSGLRLKLTDLFVARQVIWELINNLGYGYEGQSWENTHGNLYHAIHMSKKLVGLLMSLIVAIAAFNVVSTLVMVVVEKQADIAILRTLGATTGAIMRIFIFQGTVIGLKGTFIGVVGGGLLTLLVGPLVVGVETLFGLQFLKSDVYPLTYLPTEMAWQDIFNVAVTALVMSFLATLYPAWQASRSRPAEILRYE